MGQRGRFVEKVWSVEAGKYVWIEECIGEFTRTFFAGGRQEADRLALAQSGRAPFPAGSLGVRRRTWLRCSRCQVDWPVEAEPWDPMLEISLGDGTGSVQTLVDEYFSWEERPKLGYANCTGGHCRKGAGKGMVKESRHEVFAIRDAVLVHAKRTGFIRIDGEDGGGRPYKDSTPIEISPELVLAGKTFTLASFAVHVGHSPVTGHYVCYRKVQHQWWRLDGASLQQAARGAPALCADCTPAL